MSQEPHHLPHFPAADPAAYFALANFLLAYDSNMKPIVGQQITLTEDNGAAAASRGAHPHRQS